LLATYLSYQPFFLLSTPLTKNIFFCQGCQIAGLQSLLKD
jgi:hypothetical protein